MSGRSPSGVAAACVAAAALLAAPALAAPPPNDVPGGSAAGLFLPYTAENGAPTELQATAELAEAHPDPGVPRCLGPTSFARTVWFRLPEQPTATQLDLEATGRTLNVVDLAAFVQPEVTPAPTPTPTPAPTTTPPPAEPAPPPARAAQAQALTREPNACDGRGAGGSDATEEPTSSVSLRVPARHPVLFEVGRRGAVRSADDERAYLALTVDALDPLHAPTGDQAGLHTPTIHDARTHGVRLAGATITQEDPADPPCPSLGSVWRRFVPGANGRRLITVQGSAAHTLTAFSGRRPSGRNVLDCVNRAGSGALQLNVPVRRRRPVWVRIGADQTTGGERASLKIEDGAFRTVVDGGPGGFDPTPYGPGGGLPSACDGADVTHARVSGPRLHGSARGYDAGVRIGIPIRVRGASICDAELRLYGPGGGIFAKGLAVRLAPGRTIARLDRLRTITPGRYRLEVRGVDVRDRRVTVRGGVAGRLGR
jgi:hypothetical protein